jgi:hypothetical protein
LQIQSNIFLILFLSCLLSGLYFDFLHAQDSSFNNQQTVLFDASLGTDPEAQGWMFVSNLFDESETERFTENGLYSFNTLADISELAGYFGINHPGIGRLMEEHGLNLIFDLQVIEEYSFAESRGGFSIILLTDDLFGLELVFKQDSIWVYTADFMIGEAQTVNTVSDLCVYSISIKDDQYEIFIDGTLTLSGPLRDYSGFGPPYNIPNFIFFGDNTSRAGAHIHLSQIKLESGEYIPQPIPEKTVLHQNRPNPFSHQTVIEYSLSESGKVRLDVFDVAGRLAATLLEEHQHAGTYRVIFDGTGFSSGLYLYRLQTNQKIIFRKFLLVK